MIRDTIDLFFGTTMGRLAVGMLGTLGILFGLIKVGEHRGVDKQVQRQERVDQKAKKKADTARRRAVKKSKTKKGPVDAFFRD